jgi:hypothetical protein
LAGRGPQTYQKRQREQQRKERQQEKLARRLQRKQQRQAEEGDQPVTASGEPERPRAS